MESGWKNSGDPLSHDEHNVDNFDARSAASNQTGQSGFSEVFDGLERDEVLARIRGDRDSLARRIQELKRRFPKGEELSSKPFHDEHILPEPVVLPNLPKSEAELDAMDLTLAQSILARRSPSPGRRRSPSPVRRSPSPSLRRVPSSSAMESHASPPRYSPRTSSFRSLISQRSPSRRSPPPIRENRDILPDAALEVVSNRLDHLEDVFETAIVSREPSRGRMENEVADLKAQLTIRINEVQQKKVYERERLLRKLAETHLEKKRNILTGIVYNSWRRAAERGRIQALERKLLAAANSNDLLQYSSEGLARSLEASKRAQRTALNAERIRTLDNLLRRLVMVRCSLAFSSMCHVRRQSTWNNQIAQKVALRLTKRGLITTFESWKAHHRYRKREIFLLGKAFGNMRNRLTALAFRGWANTVAQEKKDALQIRSRMRTDESAKYRRLYALTSISLWQDTALSSHFYSWLLVVRLQQKAIASLKIALVRMSRIPERRAFQKWLSILVQTDARRRVATRALQCWRAGRMEINFYRWRWSTQASRKEKRSMAVQLASRRVFVRSLHISMSKNIQFQLYRGFSKWRHTTLLTAIFHTHCKKFVRTMKTLHSGVIGRAWRLWTRLSRDHALKKRSGHVFKKLLKRFVQGKVLASLQHWRRYASREEAQLRTTRRVISHMRNLRTARTFRRWLRWKEHAKHFRNCFNKILRHWMYDQVASGFRSMKANMRKEQESSNRLAQRWKIVAAWRNNTISRCFQSWKHSVSADGKLMRYRQSQCAAFVKRWKLASANKAFQSWKEVSLSFWERTNMIKVVIFRARNRLVARAFSHWSHLFFALRQVKSLLKKVLPDLARGLLKRGFVALRSNAGMSKRQDLVIHRVIVRWQKSHLASCFQAWVASVQHRLKRPVVMAKVIARLANRTQLRAFNALKSNADGATRERFQFKAFFRQLEMSLVARSAPMLSGFLKETSEEKSGPVTGVNLLAAFSKVCMAQTLGRWRQYSKSCDMATRVLLRLRNRVRTSAFFTWKEKVRQKVETKSRLRFYLGNFSHLQLVWSMYIWRSYASNKEKIDNFRLVLTKCCRFLEQGALGSNIKRWKIGAYALQRRSQKSRNHSALSRVIFSLTRRLTRAAFNHWMRFLSEDHLYNSFRSSGLAFEKLQQQFVSSQTSRQYILKKWATKLLISLESPMAARCFSTWRLFSLKEAQVTLMSQRRNLEYDIQVFDEAKREIEERSQMVLIQSNATRLSLLEKIAEKWGKTRNVPFDVLMAWKGLTQSRRLARHMARKALSLWSRSTYRRCFMSLKLLANPSRTKAGLRRLQISLGSFVAKERVTRRVMARWITFTQRNKSIYSALKVWRLSLKDRCFASLAEYASCRKSDKSKLRGALKRIVHGTMVRAFESWKAQFRLARAVGRLGWKSRQGHARRLARLVFRTWESCVESQTRQQLRSRIQTLQEQLDSVSQKYHSMESRTSIVEKKLVNHKKSERMRRMTVVSHWRNDTMAKCFMAIQSYAKSKQSLRSVQMKVVSQWASTSIRSIFQHWVEATRSSVYGRNILRRLHWLLRGEGMSRRFRHWQMVTGGAAQNAATHKRVTNVRKTWRSRFLNILSSSKGKRRAEIIFYFWRRWVVLNKKCRAMFTTTVLRTKYRIFHGWKSVSMTHRRRRVTIVRIATKSDRHLKKIVMDEWKVQTHRAVKDSLYTRGNSLSHKMSVYEEGAMKMAAEMERERTQFQSIKYALLRRCLIKLWCGSVGEKFKLWRDTVDYLRHASACAKSVMLYCKGMFVSHSLVHWREQCAKLDLLEDPAKRLDESVKFFLHRKLLWNGFKAIRNNSWSEREAQNADEMNKNRVFTQQLRHQHSALVTKDLLCRVFRAWFYAWHCQTKKNIRGKVRKVQRRMAKSLALRQTESLLAGIIVDWRAWVARTRRKRGLLARAIRWSASSLLSLVFKSWKDELVRQLREASAHKSRQLEGRLKKLHAGLKFNFGRISARYNQAASKSLVVSIIRQWSNVAKLSKNMERLVKVGRRWMSSKAQRECFEAFADNRRRARAERIRESKVAKLYILKQMKGIRAVFLSWHEHVYTQKERAKLLAVVRHLWTGKSSSRVFREWKNVTGRWKRKRILMRRVLVIYSRNVVWKCFRSFADNARMSKEHRLNVSLESKGESELTLKMRLADVEEEKRRKMEESHAVVRKLGVSSSISILAKFLMRKVGSAFGVWKSFAAHVEFNRKVGLKDEEKRRAHATHSLHSMLSVLGTKWKSGIVVKKFTHWRIFVGYERQLEKTKQALVYSHVRRVSGSPPYSPRSKRSTRSSPLSQWEAPLRESSLNDSGPKVKQGSKWHGYKDVPPALRKSFDKLRNFLSDISGFVGPYWLRWVKFVKLQQSRERARKEFGLESSNVLEKHAPSHSSAIRDEASSSLGPSEYSVASSRQSQQERRFVAERSTSGRSFRSTGLSVSAKSQSEKSERSDRSSQRRERRRKRRGGDVERFSNVVGVTQSLVDVLKKISTKGISRAFQTWKQLASPPQAEGSSVSTRGNVTVK